MPTFDEYFAALDEAKAKGEAFRDRTNEFATKVEELAAAQVAKDNALVAKDAAEKDAEVAKFKAIAAGNAVGIDTLDKLPEDPAPDPVTDPEPEPEPA